MRLLDRFRRSTFRELPEDDEGLAQLTLLTTRAEPWTTHLYADTALLLPVDMLLLLADERELNRIRQQESHWLAQIRNDVAAEGIRQVLLAVVTDDGRIALEDGRHRLIVAQELGIPTLPVHFKHSERMGSGFSRRVSDVLGPLLSVLPSRNVRLERAAQLALELIEVYGNWWVPEDAATALRMGLGYTVDPDDVAWLREIVPALDL